MSRTGVFVMCYKAIFSDIDGTFLNSQHRMLPGTMKIVREAAARQVPFVLVSARMPAAMRPFLQTIGVEMPLVSYSGALVLLADGTRIYSCPMKAGLALEVSEQIKKNCSTAVVNLYADDRWYAEEVTHPAVQRETAITGVIAQQADFSTLLRHGIAPHKMLCMCEPETCAGLAKKLQQAFPMLTIVQSSDILLEIMAGNVSKAAGISVLLAHLKLRPADIVAFGDNYNDLEMIEYAGCGVAMGNAVEKIKAVADQVTASNDEEGIYKFFNRQ